LVELLAVIAIIGILAGLVLMSLGKVRQSARMAQSLGNLRTIGLAINGFLADNKERFPSMGTDKYCTPPRWSTRIHPYGLPPDGRLIGTGNQDKGSPVLLSPFLDTPVAERDSSDYGASVQVFYKLDIDYAKRSPGFGRALAEIPNPSRLITVASCRTNGSPKSGWWSFWPGDVAANPLNVSGVGDWETGKVQALFADGHVKAIPRDEFIKNVRDYMGLD
jgi:general secretion pathway protein G